jgi:hypothetical protein
MSQSKVWPNALKFWRRPGEVLLALFETQSGQSLAFLVAALFGLVQALPVYLKASSPAVLLLLAGPLLGLVGIYFFSWLLRNFSRWFGGTATLSQVRTALGLGLSPWTLLFYLMLPLQHTLQSEATLTQFYFLFFGFLVYGYVILLLSLSAALQLSPLKTFLCMTVTILVSLFPLSLLGQLLLSGFAGL